MILIISFVVSRFSIEENNKYISSHNRIYEKCVFLKLSSSKSRKKNLPPIDHSIPFSHKMLQEISIIVYYLRTTQFSICHLFLSLSLSFRYRASNPFYATTLSAIFIHPFNERRSKLQASHPRISFDRGPTGIDWVAPPGAKPEAPSWNPTFSTSFDFSNRNRMSKPRKGSREERLKYSIYISVLRQHPANWMLKSRVSAKFFPRNERMEFERG